MLKRALLFAGALTLCCVCSFDSDDHDARLTRLETLMNLVLQRLGINPDDALAGPSDYLQQLIMQGKKIEAIKIYRQQTGLGLKEAKDYVDALEHQMRGY
ncbi:MAG TPA: 50S ribosomal protein L7/L12 [Ktedonobacterales bacterium]